MYVYVLSWTEPADEHMDVYCIISVPCLMFFSWFCFFNQEEINQQYKLMLNEFCYKGNEMQFKKC